MRIIIETLHIHFTDSVNERVVLSKLSDIAVDIKETIMATKEEVLAAIDVEGQEVAFKLSELQAKIEELIAAQNGATPADLDAILLAVQNIYTPVVVDPVP